MLMNEEQATRLNDALFLSSAFIELAGDGDGITADSIALFMAGLDSDVDLDSIGFGGAEQAIEDAYVTMATFLDSLGVDERVINDALSDNDDVSLDTISAIALTFNENFGEDGIMDAVMSYVEDYRNDSDYELDSVQRKQGYKRVQVVRNGKKKWINKRIGNKKVILSPARKRALVKARLKANTVASKMKRRRSMKLYGK